MPPAFFLRPQKGESNMSDILQYFEAQDILTRAIKIIVVLIFMIIVSRYVKRFFKKAAVKAEKAGRDTGYLLFFRYVVTGVIYFLCIASIVSEIPGLDSFITALLAGSGIAAVIIGMASQEAAGNLISGVLILVFKPFKIGDQVRYVGQDMTGTVEEIGFRHTVIRTAQNKRLLIPNSLMNTNIVENANYGEDEVSFSIELGISYNSDIELAMGIMADVIGNHDGFIDKRSGGDIEEEKPKVKVIVKDFGDSAVIIKSDVWAKNTAAGVQMKSDILLEIRRRFETDSVKLAYPTITVDHGS